MPDENAVEIRSLVKKYGDLVAVNEIFFNVKRGEIFAFLGPNGAGKTTTVEILECLRSPTSGEARVLGYDVRKKRDQGEIRKRIGVLPENFNALDLLTVKENVEFFGRMFDAHLNADELIRLVGLEDKRKELFKNLSSGLKQRLGIAVALVNDPEVVFLDEPTSGLDPKARRDTWNVIRELKKKGKTVFFTTHYMEEAEALSDTVTIIRKGKIVATGTPEELITQHGQRDLLILKSTDKAAVPLIETLGLEANFDSDTGDVKVTLNHGSDMSEIVRALSLKQIAFGELQLRRSSLEDVFLNLTGERVTAEGETI